MRAGILCAAAIAVICGTSGCVKEKRDELLRQNLVVVSEMTDTLCLVKDEKSAKHFKKRLKTLYERFKANDEEFKKLERPTEAETDRLKELFGKDIESCMERLAAELTRVKNDAVVWAALSEALQSSKIDLAVPEAKSQGGPGGLGRPPKDGMGPGMGPPMGGKGPMAPPMGGQK